MREMLGRFVVRSTTMVSSKRLNAFYFAHGQELLWRALIAMFQLGHTGRESGVAKCISSKIESTRMTLVCTNGIQQFVFAKNFFCFFIFTAGKQREG